MGSADPRAYSRNKRGIAGSLIWINFDRHALLNLFKKAQGKFCADVDEIRPQYQDSSVSSTAVFASSIVRDIGPSIGSTIDQLDNIPLGQVGNQVSLSVRRFPTFGFRRREPEPNRSYLSMFTGQDAVIGLAENHAGSRIAPLRNESA